MAPLSSAPETTPDSSAPGTAPVAAADIDYDFFSGHIDYDTALAIPRTRKRLVALFRKPSDRLASLYRFWRAHPPISTAHILAKDFGPEEFFENPIIRSMPTVNNRYLRRFGALHGHPMAPAKPDQDRKAFGLAKRRIETLDALGVTDQMRKSIELICQSLGFPIPETFESVHRTDDFPQNDPRFRKVPPVEMTPRLNEALKDLIYFDDLLYKAALDEFQRRIDHSRSLSGENEKLPSSLA
jgi:hypothetical protein